MSKPNGTEAGLPRPDGVSAIGTVTAMIFEGTYRSGKIWHARVVAGDRMMLVRIEFDTAFGIVMGHLAELPGRGSDLHLARESHGAVPMRVSSTKCSVA